MNENEYEREQLSGAVDSQWEKHLIFSEFVVKEHCCLVAVSEAPVLTKIVCCKDGKFLVRKRVTVRLREIVIWIMKVIDWILDNCGWINWTGFDLV